MKNESKFKKKFQMSLAFASVGLGLGIFFACNELPVFQPVFACISSELAQGALEDPLLLVTGCAGATIEALITVIEQELANPPVPDAGVVEASASDSASGDGASASVVMSAAPEGGYGSHAEYEAHLNRILAKAKSLQAQGVK